MSRKQQTIREVMTAGPHTIGRDQPISEARRLMRAYNIRHLPVLEGGQLVGVISQRDLSLVENLRGLDPEHVEVEEAMSTSVFATSPATPLVEVAKTMADKKLGACVITDGNAVVGVFTAVDALKLLAQRGDSP